MKLLTCRNPECREKFPLPDLKEIQKVAGESLTLKTIVFYCPHCKQVVKTQFPKIKKLEAQTVDK